MKELSRPRQGSHSTSSMKCPNFPNYVCNTPWPSQTRQLCFYVIFSRLHHRYDIYSVRKHFQFKNNKINNKNPIEIIQNNRWCLRPETILLQQLLNLITHAIFPWSPMKFPNSSLTYWIPGLCPTLHVSRNSVRAAELPSADVIF